MKNNDDNNDDNNDNGGRQSMGILKLTYEPWSQVSLQKRNEDKKRRFFFFANKSDYSKTFSTL